MSVQKTDPLIAELSAFIHAATALGGMLSTRLAALNPKGLREAALPVETAVLIDRLRTVNMEVAGVRGVARTLRDDLAGDGHTIAARGRSGPPGGGEIAAQGSDPPADGEPGGMDTRL